MTSDEQEALSHKYHAHGLLALSSGRFALFDPGRKLLGIYDAIDIYNEIQLTITAYEIREPERGEARVTELNLEELGL